MPITYRRPGVYLEESLLVNSSDTASTFTVGCFIGVAEKGPILDPIRVESWSDYVTTFGGFNPITPPAASDPNDVTTESFGQLNYANFATLQTDPTNGTGYFPGAGFTAGQFVKLNDGSMAHYTRAAMATNRGAAAPNTMFAADADITAADCDQRRQVGTRHRRGSADHPGTAGAAPTSGTFTLTILGVTTAGIAWNAAAAAVKTAIDTAIPGNTITVGWWPSQHGVPSRFTFTGYGHCPGDHGQCRWPQRGCHATHIRHSRQVAAKDSSPLQPLPGPPARTSGSVSTPSTGTAPLGRQGLLVVDKPRTTTACGSLGR